MTTSRALPRAAALLTAGAATIHLGVAQAHFTEWWASGAFFLGAAAAQSAWAVAAWTRPPVRRLLGIGAALNLGLVAIWALSRTAGIPLSPGGGVPEPVGSADLITVAMEGLATVAITAQAWTPRAGARLVGSSGRRAMLLGAGVAVAVVTASGVALAAPERGHAPEPGHAPESGEATISTHSDGHLGLAPPADQPGVQPGPEDAAGAKHTHPNLPDTSTATREQTAAAEKLLADTIDSTTAYRDLAAARAAGYDVQRAWDHRSALLARSGRTSPGDRIQLVHVPNRAFRTDGRILDAARPETLVYAHTAAGEFLLVGAMFTAERKDPPTSYLPYLRWHTHSLCRGGGVARLRPVDGVCADGTVLTESGAMAHLWFVDAKELPCAYAIRPPREQIVAYQKSLPRG